jgi:hypothetical protein
MLGIIHPGLNILFRVDPLNYILSIQHHIFAWLPRWNLLKGGVFLD